MKIHVFEVPYDSGQFQQRMGMGPSALLKAGLMNRLRFLGHEVSTERVRLAGEFPSEIQAAFSVARQLSPRVMRAHEQGGLVVVLSGNCNAAMGTIAGLDPARVGVLWFDAHGEFNTPETTGSGFLDGMGLATVTGHCWRRMAEEVPNFSRLSPKQIALIGVRDLEEEEQELLEKSGVQRIPADEIRDRGMRALLSPVVKAMSRRVEAMYVHFDLDVLDSSIARWNEWSSPGGLSIEQVEAAVELLAGGPPIAAAGFASYHPELDPDNSYEAARRLLDCTLAVAGG